MYFLILLLIIHASALTPYWEETPHIQTMTVIYATSAICSIGTTSAYSYLTSNITRTFDIANDGIKGFASVCSYSPYYYAGAYIYYNYYRHYVRISSIGAASLTF